jgi:hypothetical protein
MTSTNLLNLIPVLTTVYGAVLGGTALVSGWQFFRDRRSIRYWRGELVPPMAASVPGLEGTTR